MREYAPTLALRKHLEPKSVLLAVSVLPVRAIEESVYRRKMFEARERMELRDPDDVDLLALALHLRIPVWSNDKDFEAARVKWFTTAQLLYMGL